MIPIKLTLNSERGTRKTFNISMVRDQLLTPLLAYVSNLAGTYLIEEPENGIHPRAVETVFQSLSSVYDAQILCATHSPVILSMARPESVLCFARDATGATDIVRGDEHSGTPRVDLADLYWIYPQIFRDHG